jgi:hypothetical protein
VACRRERRDGTQRDSPGAPSRANLADVLPDKSSRRAWLKSTTRPSSPANAIEEASLNGHFVRERETGTTPNKPSRIRPASDQMIGKGRLRSIRGLGEGEFHPVHILISCA